MHPTIPFTLTNTGNMALEGVSFTLAGTPVVRVTAATVSCATSLAPGNSDSNCAITVPFVADADIETGEITITDVTVTATAASGGGLATHTLTGQPRTITVTKTPVLTIEVVEAVSACTAPTDPGV